MDNSGQHAFIDRIRSALGHAPAERRGADDLCTGKFTAEAAAILDRIKQRTAAERQQLIDRLMEMAAPINLKVPENVYIRNENMSMELEYLSFALVNNHPEKT